MGVGCIRSRFTLAGQQHVLQYFDEARGCISKEDTDKFLAELESVDVEAVCEYFSASTEQGVSEHYSPLTKLDWQRTPEAAQSPAPELTKWRYSTYHACSRYGCHTAGSTHCCHRCRGELAVVVVATAKNEHGASIGESTIGLASQKTVWQLLLDKLHRV